jgi:DNA processing protein
VAVLGNGIDLIYPVTSRPAALALLARGGAILSEYPPGVPPLHYHFPARNRILSGLCRAMVIVQAPERSGALITAEYALDQGRDLWVHAVGIQGSVGAGTRRLADAGAPLIGGAVDLLHDWGIPGRGHTVESSDRSEAERLARMMKEEMDGNCAVRGGGTYWRA